MSGRIITPAIQLYGYQKRWVQDPQRFKIGLQARQTGKTFTTTLEVVDDCFEAMVNARRERWVILSRGERQAKEAMDEGVKRHAKAYSIGFEESEFDWVSGSGVTYKALEVTLPHGSRVTALPANPDTARGFSANVMLDEFGFHQDSRAIWGALFPVISRPGLKLRVVSTPNGRNNKFAELWHGKDDGWSRHRTDIYEAVRDGLPRDIDEMRRALGDPELWAQEFECQFLDGASAWLTHEVIAAAEHEASGLRENYEGGICYVGVDIARRRDLFVIWVLELVGDVLWTREVIVRRNATFSEQDYLLDEVMRFYNVAKLKMDQTGMGEKPVEDAQRRYGSGVVEGVILSGPRGLSIATLARQKFEDRKVRTPAGDLAIRTDLRQIQKVAGPTGNPRIITPREAGGHADRAWAAFLALDAADAGGITCHGYISAPKAAGLFGRETADDDNDGVMRMRPTQRARGGRFNPGAF